MANILDDPQLRDLWARHLEGAELSDAEAHALSDAIASAGADERRELLVDEGVARLLPHLTSAPDQASAARFVALIEAERRTEDVVAAVGERLRAHGAALAPRRARRWWWWAPAGAVAAVAAAVALSGLRWDQRQAARLPHGTHTVVPANVVPPIADGGDPLPVPASLPAERVTVRLDTFESGRRPADWSNAPLGDCPPRPGNRYCLRAARNAADGRNPHLLGVRLARRPEGLFVHQPGTVVAFDYWVGETVGAVSPQIHVWMFDRTQRAELFHAIGSLRAGQWVRVELRVEDFRPEHPERGHRTPAPGAVIDFLLISTSWVRQDVLFVDNVEIARAAGPPAQRRGP